MPVYELKIKRQGAIIATVNIDEKTIYNGEFMGMNKIVASFITHAPIPIQLDDYIEYDAGDGVMRYKIKTPIGLAQIDSKTFRYELTFFSPIYDMHDEEMIHLGRTKFSYTGTPLELLSLIVDCMNADGPGWSIGDCSMISEPESFSFDQQSPRTALTQVAERFKLEYKVVGKEIYLLESLGTLQNITLKYGRGQGLKGVERQSVDESFATVWRGYGGTQNILPSYRNGMDRLALDAPFEINVDKYGRKKGSVTFEDIYPKRTSTLTAVAGLLEFTDSTLDFDLNAQTKVDGGAKIIFKSGELAGGEGYSISSYNHTTKTMRIRANKDEAGNPIPNATFEPKVGDKYTIIGITMPQTYFDAAHAELQAALEKHAKAHCFPPVAFPLHIDEKYIREMELKRKFVPGDSIRAISESLGIDTPLRLQSVSWPLVNPAEIEGVVSDVVQYSSVGTLINAIIEGKKQTAKSVALALNTRQIADEIANNAILDQFRSTYVGERVVMTGAFVTGNPESGEVAGINGADDSLEAIRFWAGSSYADKENAPFHVTQGGKLYATDAIIKGVIEALSGKIGFLDVNDDVLSLGSVPGQSDPWAAFTSAIRFYRSSYLYRLNGAVRGDIREIAYNIYSNMLGSQYTEAARITNNIENIGAGTRNTALSLEADKAGQNIALNVVAGDVLLNPGARVVVQENINVDLVGLTTTKDVRVGGEDFIRMKWVNGILVSIENV